jgi:hypothetical protein
LPKHNFAAVVLQELARHASGGMTTRWATEADISEMFKAKWLRLALAVVALVGVYAALGFGLAPNLLRAQAVDFVKKTYGRELQIGTVRLNPFLLQRRRTIAFSGFIRLPMGTAALPGFCRMPCSRTLSAPLASGQSLVGSQATNKTTRIAWNTAIVRDAEISTVEAP